MRVNMEELNNGDVVYLKSGGPSMTIRKKNASNECFCEWFNKDGELKSSLFSKDSLTKNKIKKSDQYSGLKKYLNEWLN